MLPEPHLQVLKIILSHFDDPSIAWVVTGSAGWALQGVPVAVHDIDLQTSRAGAYAIERRLAEFIVTPVRYLESERIRSYLGKFSIGAIQVEVMGDIQKRLEDGSWEEPVQVETYRHWIEVVGLQVPVLSLEYEYQAYLKLGRPEKAQQLWDWLHQ